MAVYYIKHPELGIVQVRTRTDARNISARYLADHSWRVTCPSCASRADIMRFLAENCTKLRDISQRSSQKQRHYSPGDTIQGFGFSIGISADSPLTDKIVLRRDGNHCNLSLPSHTDFTSPSVTQQISRCITRLAEPHFPQLVQFAQTVAAEVGAQPRGYVMGRGARKLGHCTTDRIIQLSVRVLFLPEPLIRLIVCHELAHLTHFNHSAAFHALCNQYLAGNEATLNAQLKAFPWPVL